MLRVINKCTARIVMLGSYATCDDVHVPQRRKQASPECRGEMTKYLILRQSQGQIWRLLSDKERQSIISFFSEAHHTS